MGCFMKSLLGGAVAVDLGLSLAVSRWCKRGKRGLLYLVDFDDVASL